MRLYTWGTVVLCGYVLLGCADRNSSAQSQTAAQPAKDTSAADLPSTLPGFEMSKLDDSEKRLLARVAGKVPSPCGKAQSLLKTVKGDPSCRRGVFALRYAAELTDKGYLESEIAEQLEKRYGQAPAELNLTDVPFKGDPKAPVTIVEFADFECPHCKALQPLLSRLVEEYPKKIRVYFKHFPLKNHGNAETAAVAAAAAAKQGKFWSFTAKVWENQNALTPPDIEKYAKESGLDVAKWKADLGDTAKMRVAKDRAEGDALNIVGTPVVYINGRKWVSNEHDYESLKAWVEEELALLK